MFDLERAIAEWCKQMLAAGIKTPVPLDELENHLREEVGRLTVSGLAEERAFRTAVGRLGESHALGREFKKVKHLTFRGGLSVAVALLGSWYVLKGLNVFVNQVRIGIPHLVNGDHGRMGVSWFIPFSALLLFMGLGLIRRKNCWRVCALGWLSLCFLGEVVSWFISPAERLSLYSYAPHIPLRGEIVSYLFVGLSVPYVIFYSISLITVLVIPVGFFLLTRPLVRSAFGPASFRENAMAVLGVGWCIFRQFGLGGALTFLALYLLGLFVLSQSQIREHLHV